MDRDLLRALKDANVLTKSQMNFLDEVFSAIKFQIDDHASDGLNDITNYSIAIKIREIEKQFRSVIKHLKKLKSSREKFLSTYPLGGKKHESGIVKLKNIAKDIFSNRYGINMAKVVGYSLVGGAISLISAITVPFTLGLTTPFAFAGGSMMAVGCSAAIGTYITEFVRLKNYVSEAQEIVKEDKEYFTKLNDWMTCAEELEKALAVIFTTDIVGDLKESVKKLTEKVSTYNRKEYQSRFQIRSMLSKIFNDLPASVKGSVLCSIGSYIMILVATDLLYQNSDTYVSPDFATTTMKLDMGYASIVDDTGDIALIANPFTRDARLAKNIGKSVGRGIAANAGIALDIVSMVRTSIDRSSGSLSPEADAILKESKELEKEAKLLKEKYGNLR